jgi:hypothetical protein
MHYIAGKNLLERIVYNKNQFLTPVHTVPILNTRIPYQNSLKYRKIKSGKFTTGSKNPC